MIMMLMTVPLTNQHTSQVRMCFMLSLCPVKNFITQCLRGMHGGVFDSITIYFLNV